MHLFPSDVKRLQVNGDWRDVVVDETSDVSDLQEAIDEATERTASSLVILRKTSSSRPRSTNISATGSERTLRRAATSVAMLAPAFGMARSWT